MRNVYRVVKPFYVTLDVDYDWAMNSILDFKTDDLVKVDDSKGVFTIPYARDTGHTDFWGKEKWEIVDIPVNRDNLKWVEVCKSSVTGEEQQDCISPNATVIDTIKGAEKKVLGMKPALGYTVICAALLAIGFGAVKIFKNFR